MTNAHLSSSFQTAPIFRDERTRLRPFATPPISGSLLFPKLDGDGIPPIFPPRRLPHHRSREKREPFKKRRRAGGKVSVSLPPLLLVTPHEVESSVCASLPLSSVAPGLNYFFPPSSSSSIFLANGKVHLGDGASPPPLLPPPFSLLTPRRRSGKVCAMAFWRKKVVQERRRGEMERGKNFFALFAAHAR